MARMEKYQIILGCAKLSCSSLFHSSLKLLSKGHPALRLWSQPGMESSLSTLPSGPSQAHSPFSAFTVTLYSCSHSSGCSPFLRNRTLSVLYINLICREAADKPYCHGPFIVCPELHTVVVQNHLLRRVRLKGSGA